jgi:3',5'-cyclic AMP phosphodiesterase CpdA
MATIVQLSDVHLEAYPQQAHEIIDALVEALALFRAQRGASPDLLVVTGDLFDDARVPPDRAVHITTTLLDRIDTALGAKVPAIILPGNHDRRVQGLVGPHRRALFDGLRAGLGDRVHVAGCETPFLAEIVPREVHRLAASLVCIDSTFVPTGLISAGGVLRQSDLLEIADLLDGAPTDDPLVLLTHHHLIPTPLTDLSRIDTDTQSRVLQWLAKHVLAGIISNADHEEWMMTALGAGTALSTLHTLERAIVVLHGHKHYPTVRALRGTTEAAGDLMLVAAGSAGLVLSWDAVNDAEAARLWPSFNVIDIDAETLAVDSVAFAPLRPGHPDDEVRLAIRPLARARREGARWSVHPVPPEPANAGPQLARNEATYSLSENAIRPRAWWNIEVVRRVVKPAHAKDPSYYAESVTAPRFASMTDLHVGSERRRSHLPSHLRLPVDGTEVRYRVAAALCRSLSEVERTYGALEAFESVDLLNRYQCDRASLTVRGLPKGTRAFGSATDLTSGQERPVRVTRHDDATTLVIDHCPPRTLLEIAWRAER